jgi:hypothetical protein
MMRLPRPAKQKGKKPIEAPERPTPERFDNERSVEPEQIRKIVKPKRIRRTK